MDIANADDDPMQGLDLSDQFPPSPQPKSAAREALKTAREYYKTGDTPVSSPILTRSTPVRVAQQLAFQTTPERILHKQNYLSNWWQRGFHQPHSSTVPISTHGTAKAPRTHTRLYQACSYLLLALPFTIGTQSRLGCAACLPAPALAPPGAVHALAGSPESALRLPARPDTRPSDWSPIKHWSPFNPCQEGKQSRHVPVELDDPPPLVRTASGSEGDPEARPLEVACTATPNQRAPLTARTFLYACLDHIIPQLPAPFAAPPRSTYSPPKRDALASRALRRASPACGAPARGIQPPTSAHYNTRNLCADTAQLCCKNTSS